VTRHAPETHKGLYDKQYEHDACGVAFVADLAGRRDHGIVAKALIAISNTGGPEAPNRTPATAPAS